MEKDQNQKIEENDNGVSEKQIADEAKLDKEIQDSIE